MKNIFIILSFFIFLMNTNAQDKQHPDAIAYIEKYKDIAVAEMKRAKIPASITLAQGLYESGFGKSYLATNTNNHFGIKCHETWTGKTFKYTDDAPNECFRVYDNAEQSYIDHSEFLMNRKRYANLFTLDIKDYKAWAYELKAAGYATNPKYPENLIKYIELYELYKFDGGTHVSYQPVDVKKQKTDQFLSTPIKVEPPKEKVTEYVELNLPNQPNVGNEGKNKKQDNKKSVDEKKEVEKTTSTKPKTKKVYEHNKLKAVKMYNNESLQQVAQSLKIGVQDLMKYNDIKDENIVLDNQYLYVENKKTKSKTSTHKVKANDNMWSISQKYGVQLSSLLKMNQLENGEEPKVGSEIVLKGKIKNKPELRFDNEKNVEQKVEQKIKTYDDNLKEKKNTTTIKDTIYPKLSEKHKTSVDSNTILEWEDAKKLVEPNPVKPFPKTETAGSSYIIQETTVVKSEIDSLGNEKIISIEKISNQDKDIDYSKIPDALDVPKEGKHLVVKGDTLYNISNRYGITIANLIEWNNIQDNIIKLGTYLRIK